VLRWNRIDRDTKNVTTKVVSAEAEEGGRDRPRGSPSDISIVTDPPSPSQPQQASPVITQVIYKFFLLLNIFYIA